MEQIARGSKYTPPTVEEMAKMMDALSEVRDYRTENYRKYERRKLS